MKLRMTAVLLAMLFTVVQAAADGEDLIGTWEASDEEETLVFQFRADGIMIENDFYDGELECVYVFPYEVDGDEVTVGEGLNWEFDSDTGELIPYEDYDDAEITFQYDVDADGMKWMLDDLLLLNIVLSELVDEGDFDEEEFGVDLEAGLEDLSEEEIEELFDAIYVLALLGFLSDEADIFIDGDSLDADEDSSVEEIYDGIFLAALAYELDLEDDVDVAELPADSDLALGIMQEVYFANALIELLEADLSIDELDVELDGDGDDLIPALAAALDVDESEIEDLALEIEDDLIGDFDSRVEELEASFDEFDEGFTAIGEIGFQRSSRGVVAPSGQFTLPSGITAVEERSWGQVKDLLSAGMSR